MLRLKALMLRSMVMPGCVALLATCLVACESVPIEESARGKALAGNVSIGIRPVESQVLSGEPLEVLFYLSNGTDVAKQLLPWGTPLEKSLTADRFTVSIDGEVIPYSGPVVKRPAPRPEDYLLVAVGEKKENVVSISNGYDVSAAGEYEIVLKELVFQKLKDDILTPVIIEDTVVITRQ